MIEVVINKDFGGFGLSNKALLWLREKNCSFIEDCEPYKLPYTKSEEYISVKLKSLPTTDTIKFRSNPLLVECVKTLGEEANDDFSELKIVEIPENINVYIHDYDGLETIQEYHRSWS